MQKNKFTKIILVLLIGLWGLWGTAISLSIYNIYEKPSYDYLKSVTVLIQGEGEQIGKDNIKFDMNLYKNIPLSHRCRWEGTGVIFNITKNYTYILTNAHVAGRDLKHVILHVQDNKTTKYARIIEYHADRDLAIIRIKGKLENKKTIKGISKAKPQDEVYVVGHHLGRPYVYGEGVFAGYEDEVNIIQVPCMWGNSGSGIFNKKGKLIALIFAISVPSISIFPVPDVAHALAIDYNDIKEFIEEYVY